MLELVRLGRENVLKGKSLSQARDKTANDTALPNNEGTEKEVELMALEPAGKEDWLRQLKVNAAYAPMTVHYSLENGLLKESAVGVLGLIASGISLMDAWKKTT